MWCGRKQSKMRSQSLLVKRVFEGLFKMYYGVYRHSFKEHKSQGIRRFTIPRSGSST